MSGSSGSDNADAGGSNNNHPGENGSDFLDMEMIFDSVGGETDSNHNNHNNAMYADDNNMHRENIPSNQKNSGADPLVEELSNAAFFAAMSNPNGDNQGVNISSITLASVEGDAGNRPAWHNLAMDKETRQTMILEIARLLKLRKKNQPSTEWLQQLPHKARKLEERLYRTASSLSAYKDLSTLKNRLRKVAQMITKQYTTSKARHSFAIGSRRASGGNSRIGSAFSLLRSSVNSAPTQSQSYQNRASVASLDSFNSLNQQMPGSDVPSQIVTGEIDSTRHSNSMKMIPETQRAGSHGDSGGANNANDSSMLLEQQKFLNEKLRLEIEENIRKQNEMFQQMQSRQGGSTAAPQGLAHQNSTTTAALQNQLGTAAHLGGLTGSLANSMMGMQQQVAAMQQDSSMMQPQMNMQGMASFPIDTTNTALNLMNNPAAAAHLQAMLLQQQQQQQHLSHGMNSQMSMHALSQQQQMLPGNFPQQNMTAGPNQQQLSKQQQGMIMHMLQGQQGLSANATSSGMNHHQSQSDGIGGDSSHPPLSPGSFNW